VSGGTGQAGKANSGKAVGRAPGSSPRPAISSTLYERYKDALRRGHVAALRGRNDVAIEAYQEAASIAPDRALPHASIGGILAKQNRPADAVAAYDRALALAPRDETALRGMAETLTRLGRRPAAADALDRLAVTLEAGGRTADATDAARRALELAETPERRGRVEELAARLRAASPRDEAAERALSQALKVLEPEAVESPTQSTVGSPVQAIQPEPAETAEAEPATWEEPTAEEIVPIPVDADDVTVEAVVAEPVEAAASVEAAAPAAEEVSIEEIVAENVPVEAAEAATGDEVGAGAMDAAEVAAEPEPEIREPLGLGIALGAAAEAQLYAGRLAEAHSGLLAAARAHRRADRLVAALDACYLAIGLAPSDPELHLLLAEIYLDRGWRSQATEKLLLLNRLAQLDDDPGTRERLCALVSARIADEPRLAELCA